MVCMIHEACRRTPHSPCALCSPIDIVTLVYWCRFHCCMYGSDTHNHMRPPLFCGRDGLRVRERPDCSAGLGLVIAGHGRPPGVHANFQFEFRSNLGAASSATCPLSTQGSMALTI